MPCAKAADLYEISEIREILRFGSGSFSITQVMLKSPWARK